MIKPNVKTIIIVAAICLTGTSSVLALSSKNIELSKPTITSNAVKPEEHNSQNYNNNPKPLYTANKNIDSSSLISKANILKKLESNQIKTKNSFIKSVKLETWSEHVLENNKENTVVNLLIDPERMVWVILTSYPDGITTKAGFYSNAILTSVYDAQTGDLLESTVTGENINRRFLNK
ncbi:hypothetical protein M2651_09335 [Clostridium sp. SYSU_GA19001]|uniref:hypothetical protein n=1 Tax=Clostridium caldaquaticum TaxID=2940653 RepID=UPI0020770912|nr:hypothetical protein [Clostridium caldaquaticum]MCM8711231.1 hypothetical protein [Clostridium caldaquaticum]